MNTGLPQASVVTMQLKRGEVVTKDYWFARGDVGHPLEMSDIRDKYDGLVEFAETRARAQAQKAASLI